MKTLIAEDDFVSRLLLQKLMKNYGPVCIAVNGKEAVEAVRKALDTAEPFDLICLDIMMPEMSGQEALKEIRRLEAAAGIPESNRAKIMMTAALADQNNVMDAIRLGCDSYVTKPIQKAKLLEELCRLALIA